MAQKGIYALTLELKTDTAKLTKGVKTANTTVGNFQNKFSKSLAGIKSNILVFAAAAGVAFKAVQGFAQKSIAGTSATAAQYKEMMGGISNATDAFFASVATGDFSNLIDNLKKANEAGREYEATLKILAERQMGADLTTSAATKPQKLREVVFRDRDADPIARKAALAEWVTEFKAQAKVSYEIARDEAEAQKAKLEGLGIESKLLDKLYTDYESRPALIEAARKKLKEYNDLQKELNIEATNQADNIIPNWKETNRLREEQKDILRGLTSDEKEYMLALNENDRTKQENISAYIQSKIKANNLDGAQIDAQIQAVRIESSITMEMEKQTKESEKLLDSIKEISNITAEAPTVSGLVTESGESGTIGNITSETDAELSNFYNEWKEETDKIQALNDAFNDALQDSIGGFVEGLVSGDLIGAFASIITAIGNFAIKLGGILLAQGIAIEAFKESLKKLQGIVAIGAGVALIAAGVAFVALAKGGLKGYKDGTMDAPGGWSIVGEDGPEKMYVPRHAQIFSNSQSNRMMGGEIKLRAEGGDLVGVMNYNNLLNSL